MFQTTKQDKWKNNTKNSHPLKTVIIIIITIIISSSSTTTTATMVAACGIWVIHIPEQELSVLGTAHHLAKTQFWSKFWTWKTRKTQDSDWDCSILNNGDNHCFFFFLHMTYVQAYLFILLLVSTSCFLEDEGLPPQFLEMTQRYMVNPSPTLQSLLFSSSPSTRIDGWCIPGTTNSFFRDLKDNWFLDATGVYSNNNTTTTGGFNHNYIPR